MSKEHEKQKHDRREEAVEKEQTPETEIVEEEIPAEEVTEKKTADERVKELETENEKLRKDLEETKNDYLRARADCENVRKRSAADVRNAYADGKLEAVTKVLAIGDSLDWALKMPLDEKTKEGIEKLVKKYNENLVALGVKEFSPEVGSAFDPNSAEAVMQVDGEDGDEPNSVKQVFGRGYKLGEKVIRYAQVSVVR
ncbi:MAG: nucleotide exchange factor GrpE [Candidatus Borkfalkiaceae bacterium]|nr:nucleotide exchange factor GrpE [Eubacteriales bacterium]MDY5820487.1 nucleotide exchange factor GrpE [Christensenellaceae bacterium]